MLQRTHLALIALAASLALTGCATVMNDTTQPMRIDARTADGAPVTGADCTASNDKGYSSFRSGDTVAIRRSSKDLDIRCTRAGLPEANGRATSRTNAGLWGNLIIGGGVGMIVDHTKGTAYTYPTWVQLVFGQTLAFDRRAEDDGKPVAGVAVGQTHGALPAAMTLEAVPPGADGAPAPAAVSGQRQELDPAKRCVACQRLRGP